MDSSPDHTSPRTDALEYLRIGGTDVELGAGETVIHKGDPGTAVYLVLSGELEARLRTADGRHLVLSRLGPGEFFGELSVLRNAPASADVTTLTQVSLLRYPAELFPTALAECEPVRDILLERLAQNLHHTTADAWGLYKREQAFADLVRAEGGEDKMVAASARMRAVRSRLEKLGGMRVPVLITGEAGTGRTLAARLLHQASGDGDRALIVVDCQDLPADGAHAAIFGYCVGSDFREASGCFGAVHLAHGGDLILRNLEALSTVEQENLAQFMRDRSGGSPPDFPDVRVIATQLILESAHHGKIVVEGLCSEFSEVVRLPNLVERPRDIIPLARHFLAELGGADERQLSRSAEHALVSLRCPVRNVDELRDVVEMAAGCSGGSEIRADHIFSGLGEEEVFGHPLGQPSFIARLVHGSGLRVLRAATLIGFLAAIGLCVAAGSSGPGRLANGFIWTIWEPIVFASFLLAGALWCTVCPLSTAGRLAKRLVNLERPPLPWLGRGVAAALPVIGFSAILWVEWFFHMTETPFGSGLLLGALILGSVAMCIIFEREVWCRHLCPLGHLAVTLAPAAPLSLAADRQLCASSCTTHECYKGTDEIPGCTVFHHPLNTCEAHFCKLCGDCLASCPHASTGLYVRPPLQGAWRLGSSGSYPSAFALTLLLLAPLFLAGRTDGPASNAEVLTAAGIAAVAIGLLVGWRLPNLLGKRGKNTVAAPRVAAALAVLAWGPLMAVQLGNIELLRTLHIRADLGTPWPGRVFHDVTLFTLAAVIVILVAAGAAAIILWRTRVRCRKEFSPIPPMARWVLTMVWIVSVAVSLALVV